MVVSSPFLFYDPSPFKFVIFPRFLASLIVSMSLISLVPSVFDVTDHRRITSTIFGAFTWLLRHWPSRRPVNHYVGHETSSNWSEEFPCYIFIFICCWFRWFSPLLCS